MGDKAGEGNAYCNLGNAYDSLGDFKQAMQYHKQALSTAKEVGDKEVEGTAYGNLGHAHYSLGDLKQAIKYHRQHLDIAKEVGDRVGEGCAYGNLGKAHERIDEFKLAIEYLTRYLTLAKEVGDKTSEGGVYGNLGNAHYRLGDYKQAIEYHKQHLSIAKEVGDRLGEGNACGNLRSAYYSLDDLKQAVRYHKQRLTIAKEVGDKAGEGRAYANLGNVHYSLGDIKQAIDHHKRHLNITKEVGDRAREGRAYGNLGNAHYALGDFEQAVEYHMQNLSISKEVGDRPEEGRARFLLGRDFEFSGSLCDALDYYRSSVQLFDNTRALLQSEDAWKISLLEVYCQVYTALVRTLLKNRETDAALCAAQQGRAQALVDFLKSQYGVLGTTSMEVQSCILTNLSTQTVFLAHTINFWVLRRERDVHFNQKEIEREGPHDDPATLLMETTFKEIEAGVGVRCENRSLDELSDYPSSNREADEKKGQSYTCTNNSLRCLYDVIIGPIVDLLEGDELIIVPDGPLCWAPFAALSETIRIRTVPSLTSLKLITDSPKDYHNKPGALLVGDPCLEEVVNQWGKPIYSQLPHARQEVEMIGKLLKTTPLTARNATKGEVLKRMASVALVHIAAHGRKETGEVALAPNLGRTSKCPEEEDYILKMSDVQAVRLRARLVVLSCCHSGRGEINSEGVVGMARAFLAAGARSVLVSLWAVDDEATMLFMKSFYQQLADGKSANLALHQSMKSLRESEQFGAAKYWAPFVLIGDDVKLDMGDQE